MSSSLLGADGFWMRPPSLIQAPVERAFGSTTGGGGVGGGVGTTGALTGGVPTGGGGTAATSGTAVVGSGAPVAGWALTRPGATVSKQPAASPESQRGREPG